MKTTTILFTFFILLIGTYHAYSQQAIKSQLMRENLLMEDSKEITPDLLASPENFTGMRPGKLKSVLTDYGNAPEWTWVKQFGGSGSDVGRDVIVDGSGNMYLLSYFSGEITLWTQKYYSVGFRDILLIKINSAGMPVWAKQISPAEGNFATPSNILFDANGDILITGYFTGESLKYDMLHTLYSIGTQDIFVAKYDVSGNLSWIINYGTSEIFFNVVSTVSDSAGNIYVSASDGSNYTDLIKMNPAGQIQWNNTLSVNCQKLAIANSQLYLIGDFIGIRWFGDIIIERYDLRNMYLARSDLDGIFQWVWASDHQEGSYGSCNSMNLAVDHLNMIYVVGYYYDEVILDDIIFNMNTNYFITKFNQNGELIWAMEPEYKTINPLIRGIFPDSENNLYVYIKTYDTITFAGLEISKVDEIVARMDQNGTGIWYKTLDNKIASGVEVSPAKVYLTGSYSGNIFIHRYDMNINKEWAYETKGNYGYGYVYGMETDAGSNLYTYGYIGGNAEIFGQIKENYYGSFISKHDKNGQLAWIRYIEGSTGRSYNLGNCFEINRNTNSLFLTGFVNDKVIIGGTTLFPEDGNTYFARFDVNGNFYWAFQLKDIGNDDLDISSDNEGNLIIGGVFKSDTFDIGTTHLTRSGNEDLFVAKYDKNKNFKWALRFGGDYRDWMTITSCDDLNNIYITSEIYPALIDFNGTIFDNSPETEGDVIFAKLDPDGNLLWIKSFGNSEDYNNRYYCFPTNIRTDPAGNSYIHGWHGDAVYFDDFSLTCPQLTYSSLNYYSYFTGKFDPEGNATWIKSINMGRYEFNYNEIDIDDEGNCFIMARFRDTLNFIGDYRVPCENYRSIFFAKYLNNGDLAWVKTLPTTYTSSKPEGIAVIDPNSLYVGGYFAYLANFDQFQLSASNTNGFIALLEDKNVYRKEFVTDKLISTLEVFPNPFKEKTTVHFPYSKQESYRATVYDLAGKTILRIEDITSDRFEVERGNLPSGVYIIEVKGTEVYRGKLVVE